MAENLQELKLKITSLEKHLRELNDIGISLSTEKNLDRLLEKILHKAREITSADSGSLYLVEKDESEPENLELKGRLTFKLAQNDSIPVPFSTFTIPINKKSIVGYVTLKGKSLIIDDVYELNAQHDFEHNRDFDLKVGYRTKSMLVVPMQNQAGEIIGIIQLINKKVHWLGKLKFPQDVADKILPFNPTDLELVESLASQASVAIENARLYQDIENLFEGFIRASVLAIESRDPTTSGHSERVATMTCGLADAVSRESSGPYKSIHFNEKDMRELRYASLLHDFGKIGVREEVLVKAKKLYPHELSIIENRFELIRRNLQYEVTQRKVQTLLERSREEALAAIGRADEELVNRLKEIDDYFAFVMKSNEPTVLPEGAFDQLTDIAKLSFHGFHNQISPFLSPDEVKVLSIRKGSLSEEERLAIESHVTHSYNFLKQIPWTKDLRRIPAVAYAHHEKLNGKGYPRKIKGDQIPFQTKMMTIADIFDALSARDRPYKKAVPITRALDILKMEVDDGMLDLELYRLFVDAKVYRSVIED